ncbi:MAG: Ig domain-containing protein, partial [Bacteroidales bacterium]|nr:Ig domain-containing protein [Bacteroidales bacterium]
YTFNLVVGKNRIEVASVTVQDWTTGETLSGGQATEGSAATLVTAITLNKTATTITKISGTATETLSVTAVTPDEATDKTYTWSSANTDVATVDAEGKVTAVAEGTAHIRATANDGSEVYGECTVTVLDLSAYYSKMTSCGSSAMDQIMKLRDLGKGRTSYNSSLTAAQAWELAKYRATVDGKTTYVIMSSQNEGYEIHYALSTDAAATEHTSDVDDLVDYFSSTILNMYYIAQ